MQKTGIARLSGGGVTETHSRQAFIAAKGAYAFTLAEVLITLGIIGIVAALTMPTIINKSQDKILENQYKKCKSIIANGYKLMMAKYEIFKVENLPILNDCGSMTRKDCMSKEHKEAFNIVTDSSSNLEFMTLPTDYIVKGKSEKSGFDWKNVPYVFVTADGMTYGILPDDELKSFGVVADVNGVKNPNTVNKDLYKFRFSNNGVLADVTSELENMEICSVNNPEACKTEEACKALTGIYVDCPNKDRPCLYADFTNGCYAYWTSSYYCR